MKIGEDIFVKNGITEPQIDQLIKYSHEDPEVINFTSDPKRFDNRSSFDEWLQKGRTIYTLVDQDNDLLGIIWFGPKVLDNYPQYNYTFAIRTYSSARGQGLSLPFMENTFTDFLAKNNQVQGFWLETSVNNSAAIHTYQKFGFQVISNQSDPSRIFMFKGI